MFTVIFILFISFVTISNETNCLFLSKTISLFQFIVKVVFINSCVIFVCGILHSLTREMVHVDQYGFHHQFGNNEGLLLHHLCHQLHEHYGAIKSDSQRVLSRWSQILSVNTSSYQLPLINKVNNRI